MNINISLIAFVMMATVTIIFLAGIFVIEWRFRLPAKAPKHHPPTVPDPGHHAALLEYPLLQTRPATASGDQAD